jgi:hypothetical protein
MPVVATAGVVVAEVVVAVVGFANMFLAEAIAAVIALITGDSVEAGVGSGVEVASSNG